MYRLATKCTIKKTSRRNTCVH